MLAPVPRLPEGSAEWPDPRGGEPRLAPPPELSGSRFRASLRAFVSWFQRHYGLLAELERVPDGRKAVPGRIPLAAVLFAVLLMFWLKLPSIRALDDRLKRSPSLRRVIATTGWSGAISDDTFADALQRLGLEPLRSILHAIAKRELKRWAAGRYLQSELAQRLKGVGVRCAALVARALVAIDGHELFSHEQRCCAHCLVRTVKKMRNGEVVEVTEYYHRIVVAQWIGVHPAMILDLEEVLPGENELVAAYRLVERIRTVYGPAVGTITADALYDGQPFRDLLRRCKYFFVIRHKSAQGGPGRDGERSLRRRDPALEDPDHRYLDRERHRRYEAWQEDVGAGVRYVFCRRTTTAKTSSDEKKHTGACLTDLPPDQAPPVATAMLMETRWWIEDTGYVELHITRVMCSCTLCIVAATRPESTLSSAG